MNVYADLQDKVAIVTGANGGMGRAIALALAAQGARVVASDLQPEADATLDQVPYQQADVTDEESVAGLVSEALARYGVLDIAVNAAAIETELARLADCETADFDRLMTVNLRGLFLCLKYELKAMLENGHGAIVNFASTTSIRPGPLQPAYTTSKFGVAGLTKQAAADYAGDGIRINAVAPGNIETPMLANALVRRGLDGQQVARRMPMQRLGRPEEIAEATLWLCSSASSFTTGHILAVEGGMLNV